VLSQFPPNEAFQTENTAQFFDFVLLLRIAILLRTAISSLPNLLLLLQPVFAEVPVLCANLKSIKFPHSISKCSVFHALPSLSPHNFFLFSAGLKWLIEATWQ
jgi:hypothetical protein